MHNGLLETARSLYDMKFFNKRCARVTLYFFFSSTYSFLKKLKQKYGSYIEDGL